MKDFVDDGTVGFVGAADAKYPNLALAAEALDQGLVEGRPRAILAKECVGTGKLPYLPLLNHGKQAVLQPS